MSSTQKTPGIVTTEKDQSEVVTPAGTNIGATVCESRKGIANMRTLFTRDKEMVDVLGSPAVSLSGTNAINTYPTDYNFYAGQEFLKESDALYVVRATNGTEKYSCIVVSGGVVSGSMTDVNTITEIASSSFYTGVYADGNEADDIRQLTTFTFPQAGSLLIASVAPGLDGDLIGVKLSTVATSGNTATGVSGDFDWAGVFDAAVAPSICKLSVFVKNSTNDTAWANTPDEVFYFTMGFLKDPMGRSLKAEEVVNGKSKYVFVVANVTTVPGQVYGTADSTGKMQPKGLSGGADAATGSYGVSIANKKAAWSLYLDKDKVDVNILIGAYANDTLSNFSGIYSDMETIAGTRQDCIAVVQVGDPSSISTAALLASTANPSVTTYPSYVAKFAGYDKSYDRFNDRYIYLPRAIAGAVAMARTDNVANVWDSPAGISRGGIPYSLGANVVFNDSQIGTLYDNNINTAKFVRGSGFYLWGQKTAQVKKSALDRINVRRDLIYIEKSINTSLLGFLFESNSAKTRLRAYNSVKGFLDGVQGQGGLIASQTVCDETNNTPQVIDSNTMVVDIYVQPPKSIEFIKLSVIVTRTGVSLSENR